MHFISSCGVLLLLVSASMATFKGSYGPGYGGSGGGVVVIGGAGGGGPIGGRNLNLSYS